MNTGKASVKKKFFTNFSGCHFQNGGSIVGILSLKAIKTLRVEEV